MTTESRIPHPASPSIFSWPTRVYWEDTDAGGVVYHARYVAFMERARSEWMRALGCGQERMRQEHDLVFAVRSMQLDFLKPARLDDALSVSAALLRCRRASLLFAQSVRREGEVLLTAEVRIAALDASDFRPRGMDDALYDVLKALETTESDY
ncbi:tol-pal system-associated acyl-CoA thioesterase [Xanthomonas oryzae]|uniref:tol-pal system-associated acyl-CoA thioesterase n=1 Tax=Xanthomonas oryzae TaxID=347 RepID=UPI000400E12D|nr:tol-pal system-associated acyl-CoA thioesterase [Xanthomonas oryzae]ALS94088.1 acyl-CoA thioesterase [Xanthomonas oryzae pv. oryzae]AUI91338.1 tol-pal system-associated acyl-CoA thioesterase [Xanthomonas oryzae pv. oryzae]AUI95010.1 tol-pal system-associated acyl-CoA thioesterase [Xanthomonas oryzae pv. oryzae]AUI98684.1 tol-pal system-associated acyl-CoA thioesterase [Xanthomonas oryzae pv. oryzae]AUJ02362.1 tol-pal system-associated acyl-CoA thioesterase [Xanthomonas oryzae pv. oryzae]